MPLAPTSEEESVLSSLMLLRDVDVIMVDNNTDYYCSQSGRHEHLIAIAIAPSTIA